MISVVVIVATSGWFYWRNYTLFGTPIPGNWSEASGFHYEQAPGLRNVDFYFRGADVFVPAQPGLTSEWLQRVVTFEIAAGECDFGTRNVTVSVLSAGSGFSLRIAGWNDRAAGEILRHARDLVK